MSFNGCECDRRGRFSAATESTRKCTPVIGVNLWGASPLYENPVTVVRQGKTSTSRRQGRLREERSGGIRSAKLWADGQKQHTRPSSGQVSTTWRSPRIQEKR